MASYIRVENALVQSVTPAKDGKTAYLDLVGSFGSLSCKTASANMPALDRLKDKLIPALVLAVEFRQFPGAARADGKFSPSQLSVTVLSFQVEGLEDPAKK